MTDQFLSIDPDVAKTGQAYVFTRDDSLNATDPLGLCGSNSPACGQGNLSAEAAAQASNAQLLALEAKMTNTVNQDQATLNRLNAQIHKVLPESPTGIKDENQFNAALLGDLTQLGNQALKIAQVANDTYTLYQDAGEISEATEAYSNAAAVLEPLIGSGSVAEADAAAQLGDAGDALFNSVLDYQSDVEGVASGGSFLPMLICLLICD
jgi:hypothetical protein